MNNTINFGKNLEKILQDRGNKKDFRIALKIMQKQIKFCKRIEQKWWKILYFTWISYKNR